ncbi:MAG: hypothetical protein OES09_01995 [Gammaproteobacteria bacterium]|nr:hypothetical protein [Gammaproteobacteria bacterium]
MAKAVYRYVISILILTFTAPLLAADHKIYLTAAVDQGVPLARPATEFGCTDTIYAVLEIHGLEKTEHSLNAVWRDPHGVERERTQYPFRVRGDRERIWVWLKLHRSQGAALVQFVDPSAGMGEFVGNWQIQLFIDGKSLAKQDFTVLC